MLRAVETQETEFSADDVASLLASRRAESVRRSPSGYTLAEATDPANQGRFKVKKPKRDWSVAALNVAQKAYYDLYPQAKGDSSFVWEVLLDD